MHRDRPSSSSARPSPIARSLARSALGHFVDMGDQKAEIVGIVGSIRRTSLVDEPWADLYLPLRGSASRR